MVLDFLAVDNFDFTRKIVKKNLGEKFVKMLGFVKIEFLDKKLTFRIVWPKNLDTILTNISSSKIAIFGVKIQSILDVKPATSGCAIFKLF